jgi:hypothetical protein
MNPSASGQGVLTDTSTTEAKKLKETIISTNVKYDQLRLDLGQLATSVTARKWTRSEDHIVTLGIKSRSAWRDQHATISRKLIEIDGLAKLHDLTDLQDRIVDTRSEFVALSTHMDLIILKIETAHRMIKVFPIKLPSYSGDASEELITFKDKFQKAAVDNRISRRDQLEKMRECLTGEAAAKLPLNGLMDIEEAWQFLQEAFGNSYTDLYYRLSRIGRTPGLTDRLVETDPHTPRPGSSTTETR